jgi:hypothetical protein
MIDMRIFRKTRQGDPVNEEVSVWFSMSECARGLIVFQETQTASKTSSKQNTMNKRPKAHLNHSTQECVLAANALLIPSEIPVTVSLKCVASNVGVKQQVRRSGHISV